MDCDYKADDDAEEYDYDYIFIRKDVTINGNNHIIDGNNRTRVFMVEDGYSLTLNNLTIINARADSGAGVYLKYNASLTINNVNFINNYAHDQQGAAMGIKVSNVAFKSYKKTKTVSVKLFTTKNPYNGKTYLSAGKKVTLKVNGKTYTAQIDKYGNAKFNIKLTKKGKYTAVIKFAGDKTYKAVSKSIRVTIK